MKRYFLHGIILSLVLPALLFAQKPKAVKQKRSSGRQVQQSAVSVLDETQKKQWQEIQLNFQKQQNELVAKIKNARLDLRHLMNSRREPDENALNQKLDEISGYMYEKQKLSFAKQIQFRKLISDEQWQKIQEMKKNRRKVMKRRKVAKRKRPISPKGIN